MHGGTLCTEKDGICYISVDLLLQVVLIIRVFTYCLVPEHKYFEYFLTIPLQLQCIMNKSFTSIVLHILHS